MNEDIIKKRLSNLSDAELEQDSRLRSCEAELETATKKVLKRISENENTLQEYTDYENALADVIALYRIDSYRLGYEDGIRTGIRQRNNNVDFVFSVETMTNLVSIYDAIKNAAGLFGGIDDLLDYKEVNYEMEIGKPGAFEKIYDVISAGVSTRLKFESDDNPDNIIDILNLDLSPEKRAEMLIKE